MTTRLLAVATALALTACSGGGASVTPSLPGSQPAAFGLTPFAKAKLKVKPASLNLLGTGQTNAQSVTVTEAGYTGKFTQKKSTCKGIVAAKPASGKGPTQKVTLKGSKAGSCTITFADTKGDTAILKVEVTTTSLQLEGPLPQTAKSVTIMLESVNGKPPGKGVTATVKRTLKSCSNGCTVAGPASPVGKDTYTASVADAKGGVLANGEKTTAQIQGGKGNVVKMTFVVIGPIVYTCTAGCPSPAPPNPEIDLYSTSSGAAGNSASFTATQSGWTDNGRAFTYAFTGVKGQANNCPSGSVATYSVTPASGTAGTSFAVTATNGALAGECMLTLSGGGGRTLGVLLTFTTGSIGINGKR